LTVASTDRKVNGQPVEVSLLTNHFAFPNKAIELLLDSFGREV